ncbi:MAG: beta-ketoacyl-[acyl-carrier-protein] synthase family protein [Ferruginibacter sp.]
MDPIKNTSPVFVAGLGIISAIGNNVSECCDSLENYRAGIQDINYLETFYKDQLPVAEVKLSNEELAGITGLDKNITRIALLSMMAAKEALHDSGIDNIESLRTGFISANTVGGMDKTEQFFVDFLADNNSGRLRDVINHECGSATEIVANALGIHSYVSTISTACSSSANAIFFAARLIKHGILDVAIAGGTDALTKFTLNGFNSLMILDKTYCKPFDENRQGLNLGEGAGYLVLVSERVAASLKKEMYCELSGYANRNDAYHQTASSPDGNGPFLAMKAALQLAGLHPSDIDYINLHGTGTQNNDFAEATAIQRLFEAPYPSMSSTKSFTGHTLGASGGVEAVLSTLSINRGMIYPNLRLQNPMSEFPFSAEKSLSIKKDIKNVLSNSFGFGGNCTSLIFSKIIR